MPLIKKWINFLKEVSCIDGIGPRTSHITVESEGYQIQQINVQPLINKTCLALFAGCDLNFKPILREALIALFESVIDLY